MRLAAIDIGTNTTRLLIAEAGDSRSIRTLLRRSQISRLGEGVDLERVFKAGAIERTLKALREYKQAIERERAKAVRAVATSAARDARNVDSLLRQVEKIGFKVEIISGQEEGKLAFIGATSVLPALPPDCFYLVIDIGGGSTEFILGREDRPERLESLDIGSVRLTEMFFDHDPPSRLELQQARQFIRGKMGQALAGFRRRKLKAVGVAGTITTIAAVRQRLAVYDPEKIHHFRLTVPGIEKVLRLFLSQPLDERKKLPGLEPARADIIISGTLILLETLELLGLDELTVSEHDLLDGLILSLLQKSWTVDRESKKPSDRRDVQYSSSEP